MEKKKSVGIIAVVCCIIFLTGICFAETYSQKDGLFKIDIPNGWRWTEYPDNVLIEDPQPKSYNFISIGFKPRSFTSDDEVKEALKEETQKVINIAVNSTEGTVIADEETKVDGIYARRIDYRTPSIIGYLERKPIFTRATRIYCFNKGHLFIIGFAALSEEKWSTMQKAVETFQF